MLMFAVAFEILPTTTTTTTTATTPTTTTASMCLLLHLWRTGIVRSWPSARLWLNHDLASWVLWSSPDSSRIAKTIDRLVGGE